MKKILVMLLVLMLLSGCIGGGDMPDEKGRDLRGYGFDIWEDILSALREAYSTSYPQYAPMPKSKPSGAPAPPWGTPWESMWGVPQWSGRTDVGQTGKGAPSYDWTPSAPKQEGQKSWERWMPYFNMLGIRPIERRGLTATSPAMRSRMQPEALQAMQDYMESMNMPWQSYLDWSGSMMPRNPFMTRRSWTPATSFYRRW